MIVGIIAGIKSAQWRNSKGEIIMHCVQNITQDILYLGVSDRRLALFENVFPIPRGVSYNTYLVKDEKTGFWT